MIFSCSYRVIIKLLILSDKCILSIDFHTSKWGFESSKSLESGEIHSLLSFEFFSEQCIVGIFVMRKILYCMHLVECSRSFHYRNIRESYYFTEGSFRYASTSVFFYEVFCIFGYCCSVSLITHRLYESSMMDSRIDREYYFR